MFNILLVLIKKSTSLSWNDTQGDGRGGEGRGSGFVLKFKKVFLVIYSPISWIFWSDNHFPGFLLGK